MASARKVHQKYKHNPMSANNKIHILSICQFEFKWNKTERSRWTQTRNFAIAASTLRSKNKWHAFSRRNDTLNLPAECWLSHKFDRSKCDSWLDRATSTHTHTRHWSNTIELKVHCETVDTKTVKCARTRAQHVIVLLRCSPLKLN